MRTLGVYSIFVGIVLLKSPVAVARIKERDQPSLQHAHRARDWQSQATNFSAPGFTTPKARPSCQCWSFCSPIEAHRFWARLPMVTSTGSAWYPYLQWIYHSDVPLPVDLRSFGMFLFTRAPELGMPFDPRCKYDDPPPPIGCGDAACTTWPVTPSGCPDSTCARWLNLTVQLDFDPTSASNVSKFNPPVSRVMRWKPPITPHSNFSWAEVTRVQMHYPEGIVFGCWYNILSTPYARGAGIQINVGRTIFFKNGQHLFRACEVAGVKRLRGYPAELGLPPDYLRQPRGNWKRPGKAARDWLGAQGDSHLAICVRALGYHTAQIGASILLDARPECSVPGQREPLRACPPFATELRTGWDGRIVCNCTDLAIDTPHWNWGDPRKIMNCDRK
mmetsp:Transcript_26257/g.66646  ORF Transcript_26257/g.66646 Transcript_26257/m.66646 type:complete len:390 (+) Transcript_26257:181-1350(+)